MKKIIRKIKSLLPPFVHSLYHFLLAYTALIRYKNPSRHMIVIGVTGTKGKTSTVTYLQRLLNASGLKTASLSTADSRIGNTIEINKMHMTMGGRGYIQKRLREFLDAGCECAIVETTSEGILQFRHYGIEYDSLVFTNLKEEHLVTHKTFENYRNAKLRLFKGHSRRRVKYINKKPVKRFVLINSDDENHHHFYKASKSDDTTIITYGINEDADVQIKIKEEREVTSFTVDGEEYTTDLPGVFTAYNITPAIILTKKYGKNVECNTLQRAIDTAALPGRLEKIDVGQNFSVYCDYAHEPFSVTQVLRALRPLLKEGNRLLISVGTIGGGRWKYNADKIGRSATENSDFTVMTTVDPFYDDPNEMMEFMRSGAVGVEGEDFIVEIDRRRAIEKLIEYAQDGDIVIITGKGAEMTYEVKGRSEPWDEREIVREVLKNSARNKK